jgi:predicted O-linked N-acetylglucosamine transferase (SPINDLY family)
LRLAYVSGDFGPHPVAFFLRPILQHHDRSQFEVYCYSNSSQPNEIEPTLRARSDHWRTIAGLDDTRVIDQIRSDRIDILVDLSGHTNRGRLPVFARHPAPVQATWLGYLNTTGLPAMDYRITDAHTDPIGMTEHLHAERLVRMPHSQWCYFAWEEVAPIARPHADRPDAIVFGSFNQYAKITDASLALWSRILAQLPGAEVVVFDVRQARSAHVLLARMQAHGIDAGRVKLRGREPVRDYFAAIGNVDVALDTIPYNGATTTLDALWMGVPVVGLRGDRGISRGTYSILRALRADELVARSADEYVALNVRLAREPGWRAHLRQSLRPRLAASPLMDPKGFTRDLEACYRQMWRNWCAA